MPDLAAAYEDARATMIDLARGAGEAARTTRVPACPDWSVHDLIAHVTSIASEISGGRVPADLNLVAFWDDDISHRREEFIDENLEKRRDRPLDEIIAEWDSAAPVLESMIRGEAPLPKESPPLIEWIVVTDIGQHLQDLAGALGISDTRESLATGLSLRSYVEGMRFRSAHDKLPALKIRAGTREWIIGEGEPVATLTGDPFELARAAAGRRSPDQIRAYDWEGDPEPFLVLFYPYGLREDALVE
jgi:uncharacterized protein (TIGR03083 family)